MEALDIYTLNTTTPPTAGAAAATAGGATAAATPAVGGAGGPIAAQQRAAPQQQAVRTKEEKEVLEHFAGVFGLLHPQTFKEVFTQTIDYVVERIYKNYALQIMANSFLANNVTSPIFATILVSMLLKRFYSSPTAEQIKLELFCPWLVLF